MTSINKQRFLAELGKLLTFMYEEDRLHALEMYSRMFDEAGDESALIASLVSPTKQAVVVARAYNANPAKLFGTDKSKAAPEDRDENGVPDYVQAIESVREAAFAQQPRTEERVDENQVTLFDEDGMEAEGEEPVEEESAQSEEEPEERAQSEESDGEEAVQSAQTQEPAQAEEAAQSEASAAEATESAPSEEPGEKTPAESEKPARSDIEFFSMPEEGKPDESAESAAEESVFNIDTDLMRTPRRKPKVFALIVYILFAIPITLAAILILLVPALLFLAASIASIISGIVVVSAAFSGFAVIADIMVVLGVALVLFALGLLFLWTSIWFVGGAIVGLVHGVAALCDKWCYKEVQD